jgi:hypothetical protein
MKIRAISSPLLLTLSAIVLWIPLLGASTAEFGGVKLDLRSCKHRGDRVVCELMAINMTESDTSAWIGTAGNGQALRMIDRRGRQYINIQKYTTNWDKLVSGFPAKGYVHIKGLPQSVDRVAALEFSFGVGNSARVVKWENIPIDNFVGTK